MTSRCEGTSTSSKRSPGRPGEVTTNRTSSSRISASIVRAACDDPESWMPGVHASETASFTSSTAAASHPAPRATAPENSLAVASHDASAASSRRQRPVPCSVAGETGIVLHDSQKVGEPADLDHALTRPLPADHGEPSTGLHHVPAGPDQPTEPHRVHERHLAKIDGEAPHPVLDRLAEALPKLGGGREIHLPLHRDDRPCSRFLGAGHRQGGRAHRPEYRGVLMVEG